MDKIVSEMLASLFGFPAGITVESVHPSANDLAIKVSCRPSLACPAQTVSSLRIASIATTKER